MGDLDDNETDQTEFERVDIYNILCILNSNNYFLIKEESDVFKLNMPPKLNWLMWY